MPPVLEPMLVGEDGEHALETVVGELHHHPAPLTDEVFVVGLSRPGLKALEPFTELMSPDQTAFDQEVEGAVHGGQAHLLAPLFELTPDGLYREMIVGMKDHLRDQIPLAGDRLVVLPKMTAEPFEKGGSVRVIETSHGAQGRERHWRRTRIPELPGLADVRRPAGLEPPAELGLKPPGARYRLRVW
jgi:hypothetical protein